MKEVFGYLLYREWRNEKTNELIDKTPAVFHTYESYSFDSNFIYAILNGKMDVYQLKIPPEQIHSGKSIIPVLPLNRFSFVKRFDNFFVVRIDTLWGAYSLDGEQIIPVAKKSCFEVQEILKRRQV